MITRGQVWTVSSIGESEPIPYLIISSDIYNAVDTPCVVAVEIDRYLLRDQPVGVVMETPVSGTALPDKIMAVPRSWLLENLGVASKATVAKVNHQLRAVLDL